MVIKRFLKSYDLSRFLFEEIHFSLRHGFFSLLSVALLFSLFLSSQPASAQQLVVPLDQDNDASSGCDLSTLDGVFSGAEQVLITYFDSSRVGRVELTTCTDASTNTFSAPAIVSSGGWPVGSGLGVNGADVVETAVDTAQLTTIATTLRLGFSTVDSLNQPADALISDHGNPILLTLSAELGGPATPIPTLQEAGLAFLILLILALVFQNLRHHPAASKSIIVFVIVVGGIGLVWAAIIPDGDPSDWGQTSPLAQDRPGESTSPDIEVCFGNFTGTALSIRCDIHSYINTAPSYTKGADQTVLEDAGNQTIAGWATAIDDGDGGSQVLNFAATNNTNPALFAVAPVVAANGTLSYTPAANANGSATVTLVLQDNGGTENGGSDTSISQSFVISVTAVNDAPSFTKGADQSVLEDAGAQTVAAWASSLSAGPADEAGQVLTFNLTGNTNPALFVAQPGVDSSGMLTYTPAPGATGSSTITVELQDNGGVANGGIDTSPPQVFTISVTTLNDAPSFTKGADQTVLEDAGAQNIAGWATAIDDGDGGGQVLNFNITNNTNPALFAVAPVVAANGTLSYTPAANANGSATITLELQDNGGTANGGIDTSPAQIFVINVTSVNDAPSFTKGADETVPENSAAQTVVGWATAISSGPADEAGQLLTFGVTNNTNPGLFTVEPAVASNGTLTYTPAPGVGGSADITLILQDNGGTVNGGLDSSAHQVFTIAVLLINDAPSFTPGADESVVEDAGPQTVVNWATAINDGDAGGQVLAFNIINNTNPGLFVTGPAVASNGTLTYAPADNANGTAAITLVLLDDGGTANGGNDTSTPHVLNINVNAVNDAPQVSFPVAPFYVTGNVSISVPRAVGLLDAATITDVDGSMFQVSDGPGIGDPTIATANGGVVTITNVNTGEFTYEPQAGFTGTDSFTYVVCDNGLPLPPVCSSDITVNLSVADLVWFIDSNVGGAGGSGTLSDPFRTLNEFEVVNGAGGLSPKANDCVFLASAILAYAGPVTLQNGQVLVGSGAGDTTENICGFTGAPYSATLPTTGGADPVITSTVSGINLASGNTLRGLAVSTLAPGIGVSGATVGNLIVLEMSIGGSGPGISVGNGALNVIFDQITSSGIPGSAPGIRLNNTTGTFVVNGGSITQKTGAGVTPGTHPTMGVGILLNTVAGVTLNGMQLNDFDNFAIYGTLVTGFNLMNSTIDGVNGNSAAHDEGSVMFRNLHGVANVTSSNISGGFEDNFVVINDKGSLDRLTVSGGAIGLNATATGNDGLLLEASGTATLNATVDGVTFNGARGDMLQCNAIQASTMDCEITDNTFTNTHSNIVPGGGGVTLSGGGASANITTTYDVSGTVPGAQAFNGANGNALTINYVSGAGTASGTVMNNRIGTVGNPGSGSLTGAGIMVGASSNVVHTTNIDSNVLRELRTSLAGIELVANVDLNFNATVTANDVGLNADPNNFALSAVYTLFGGNATETGTACLDIRNNVFDASAAQFSGSAVFIDQISAFGQYNLPSYAGSRSGEFASACVPGTASAGINTYLLGRGNTLIDGPVPTFPGVEASLVCGVTGAGANCPMPLP